MNLYPALLACVFPVACFATDAPLQITFDGDPIQPRGLQHAIPQYSEAGYLFKPFGPIDTGPPFRLIRNSGGLTLFPENGTTYLQTDSSGSLEFRSTSGGLFNLQSVDLAEYSIVFGSPQSITFTGFRLDGSTVSTTFTTDGIIDGTGPLADFQTFTFGPEFSGLTRVEIPSQVYSLDNLVLVPVPEPSSVGFWILGLFCMLVAARSTRISLP